MRNTRAIVAAIVCAVSIPYFAISETDTSKSHVLKPVTSKIGTALDREPPAPIYEVDPGERAGYVWAPGFWCWNNKGRLIWNAGRWIAERPGFTWVPDGWEQRADKWYYVQGYWEKNDDGVVEEDEDDSGTIADVVEKPATVRSGKKSVVKKRIKPKTDYSNKKLWPDIQRN